MPRRILPLSMILLVAFDFDLRVSHRQVPCLGGTRLPRSNVVGSLSIGIASAVLGLGIRSRSAEHVV